MNCTKCARPVMPGKPFCTSCGAPSAAGAGAGAGAAGKRSRDAPGLKGGMGRRDRSRTAAGVADPAPPSLTAPASTTPPASTVPPPGPGAWATPVISAPTFPPPDPDPEAGSAPAIPPSIGPWVPADPPPSVDATAVIEAVDPTGPSEDEPTDSAAGSTSGRRRRWLLPTAAVLLFTGAVMLGGLVVGYRISNASKVKPSESATVNLPEQRLAALDSAEQTMPDLVGMTEGQSLEALADIGIQTADVTVTQVPHAGRNGLVVEQAPLRGNSAGDDAPVELKVAAPATMPDLVGVSESDASETLRQLGAPMELRYIYDRDQPTDGVVLRTTPTAGEPLSGSVSADISIQATSIYLTQMSSVQNTCTLASSAVVVGTTTTDQALVCTSRVFSTTQSWLTYLVAGKADKFQGSVGIPADEATGTSARLQVMVDGVPVSDHAMSWGELIPLDIDLRDKSRLEFVVTPADPSDSSSSGVKVAILDGTILGSRDDIDQLPRM